MTVIIIRHVQQPTVPWASTTSHTSTRRNMFNVAPEASVRYVHVPLVQSSRPPFPSALTRHKAPAAIYGRWWQSHFCFEALHKSISCCLCRYTYKACYSEYISFDNLFVSSFWARSRLSKMLLTNWYLVNMSGNLLQTATHGISNSKIIYRI